MSQTVACPKCQANLKLPSHIPPGRKPRCPKCGEPISLSEVVPVPAPLPTTPASNPPADSSKPPSSSQSHVATAGASGSKPDQAPKTGKIPASTSAYDYLAPAQSPDELGRLGTYRILEVIGIGGMGTVFKAEDPTLRRIVALKVMLPHVASNSTAKHRFMREARAQAKVEHDHVIAIHQIGEDRGIPFLAMPLLKGQTLGAVLKQTPRLPVSEVLRIGREMAEGLGAAHEMGLVHRDIKPGNVWLEGTRQRVKILDFGLARATSEDNGLMTSEEPVTKAGAAVGTPAYMSPEQARGLEVDHRTDLFSLGVVLYQIATGELPFRGADVMAVLTALALTEPVQPIVRVPDLPPAVNALIMRLLAKKPDDRPANGETVAEEIRQVELSLQTAAGFAPYTPPSTGPGSFTGSASFTGSGSFTGAPTPHSAPIASNDPWADIDASTTGVVNPPAAILDANSSKTPATSKSSTRTSVPVSGTHDGGRAKGGGKPSMMILWIAVGIVGFALVAGLAWMAIGMASTPKGILAIDAEPPEMELILKQGDTTYTVKNGETSVPVGDYAIEYGDAWKKGYPRLPSKITITEKRTELKIRPQPPKAQPK